MEATLQALVDAAPEPWRRAFDAAVEAAPSREHATSTFERLVDGAGEAALRDWPAEDLGDLAVIVGSSPYFARQLLSLGEGWPDVARSYTKGPPSRDELAAQCGLEADDDVATLHRKLRRLAIAEMYRIGARDLLGLADLDETVTALTRLADVAISMALDRSRELLVKSGGDAIGVAANLSASSCSAWASSAAAN